jgi:hypothetical protein
MKLAIPLLLALPVPVLAQPYDLGTRLELLADKHLFESLEGDARLRVHRPIPRKVVFTADAPWEGNTSAYYGLFADERDGKPLLRMVYRGSQSSRFSKKVKPHAAVACYAESLDGIHWTKPNLGVFEWEGSKGNNIIWTGEGNHNFTAFRDDNPDTPPTHRYRALARVGKFRSPTNGLRAFHSSDCVHWKITQQEPVITAGLFDSQNLAYWDAHRGEYRSYWRVITHDVRAIRTATSTDFLRWANHADLTYPEGTPNQHLYTNAIQPYFRAPHLFVGFPTRYLPGEGQRVEPLFMISRDGIHFTRYDEPVIPEDAPKDRAGNRSNYMTWGMLQLPGEPDQISVYATEDYYGDNPNRLRRFTYRLDGFVSLHASKDGGSLRTKPLTFSGNTLVLNAAVLQGGQLSVDVLDSEGTTLASSHAFAGDSTAHPVAWKSGADLSTLAGNPLRLRFTLRDADLFSFHFKE